MGMMMIGKKPKRRIMKSDTSMAIDFANMEDNEPVTNGFQQQQNEMLHAALEGIRSPYQIGHPAGRLPFGRYICALVLGPCACTRYRRLLWMVQPLTMVSEKMMNQFIGFWVLYYALFASISIQVLFDYDDTFQNNARVDAAVWLNAFSKFLLGISSAMLLGGTPAAGCIAVGMMAIPREHLRAFLKQNAAVISSIFTVAPVSFLIFLFGLAAKLTAVHMWLLSSQPADGASPGNSSVIDNSFSPPAEPSTQHIAIFVISTSGWYLGIGVLLLWSFVVMDVIFQAFHTPEVLHLMAQEAQVATKHYGTTDRPARGARVEPLTSDESSSRKIDVGSHTVDPLIPAEMSEELREKKLSRAQKALQRGQISQDVFDKIAVRLFTS